MALSLLNRLSENESSEVLGCPDCKAIYEIQFFTGNWPDRFCPVCGRCHTKELGRLPHFTEQDKGTYLVGREGIVTGPYENEETAQANLWDWFGLKEQHDLTKSKNGQVINLAEREAKSTAEEGSPKGHEEV